MLHFDTSYSFSFDETEGEDIDKRFIEKLGVYGTNLGFSELNILPSVDIHTLAPRIATHADCNTSCDYCLERHLFYIKDLHAISLGALKELILKHEPSTLDLNGGEKFQPSFKPYMSGLFSFLDEIDPNNFIKVEALTNGVDTEVICEYFRNNPRLSIAISFDPTARHGYRHANISVVYKTILELAKIDNKRFKVGWMISTHHSDEDISFAMNFFEEHGVNWSIQPLNEVEGYFENGEDFNLDFIIRMLKVKKFAQDVYKPRRLILPNIPCLDGYVVTGRDARIGTCDFRANYADVPDYATRLLENEELTISAGVCHVCSMGTRLKIPSNIKELTRIAYTLMAYNIKNSGVDPKEYCEALLTAYNKQIEIKRLLLSELSPEGNPEVVIEILHPKSLVTTMGIYRLAKKLGLNASVISEDSEYVVKNQWKLDTDSRIEVLELLDFIKKHDSNTNYAVYTAKNFPYRLLLIGTGKSLVSYLSNFSVATYPRELYSARYMLQHLEYICTENR